MTRNPTVLHPWRLRHRLLRILAPALLLCVLQIPDASAGDGALYGPAAPPGSSFVRVFNTTDESDLPARVGATTIDDLPGSGASEFVFVPAGSHTLTIGDVSRTAQLAANRYYTAVADARTIHLIENARYDNRLKALVILYNLTDQPGLSLRTADGRATLVESVGAASQGNREVNAAKARLAVYRGDQRIAEAPPISLARGRAFSLFAIGSAEAPRLVWAIN